MPGWDGMGDMKVARVICLKKFVILKFKFWGQPEIYEAEFRVVPTLRLFSFEFGAPFDCLLGKEWMVAHKDAWIPQSPLKDTIDSGEGESGTASMEEWRAV